VSARGVFAGLAQPPGKCRRAASAWGRGSECKCSQCARRRQGRRGESAGSASGGARGSEGRPGAAGVPGELSDGWSGPWTGLCRAAATLDSSPGPLWRGCCGGPGGSAVSATNPNAARSERTSCRRPPRRFTHAPGAPTRCCDAPTLRAHGMTLTSGRLSLLEIQR
jgi:hypothetical protein